MPKLGATGLKLLKFFHVFFAVAWMGTALGFLTGTRDNFSRTGRDASLRHYEFSG